MDPTRLPFLTPVHRFMLHLFTDLLVAFILIGIEFGNICFHKLLDKLTDSATLDILYKFSKLMRWSKLSPKWEPHLGSFVTLRIEL